MTVEHYLDLYDPTTAKPFPGIDEVLGSLDRWGVCSNKHPDSGASELQRLGWHPTAVSWALDTGKSLGPAPAAAGRGGLGRALRR